MKGKIFFGDSGSLILAFLLSYILVKDYNLNQTLYADEIFLIMCFPGYDLLRLFILRIAKKKHPFSADNFHIHHILMSKLNPFKTLIATQILFFLPYISYLVFDNFFYSLFFSIILYILIFFSLKIINPNNV